LKKGETKYIDTHGVSLVVFREINNKVNAIGSPYPYHKLKAINSIKYHTIEKCDFIFVWFNTNDDEEIPNEIKEIEYPPYEPIDVSSIQQRMHYRGWSLNKINCHISDIAENGADMAHLSYVHEYIVPYLVKGKWDTIWVRGDDPELKEKLRYPKNKSLNDYRMNLIDLFITEENKKYIGVLNFENSIKIWGIPKWLNGFLLTAFQFGPGVVYIFIKSPLMEHFFFQHYDMKEKYHQYLYHDLYSKYWDPYWLSALHLESGSFQLMNDLVIWDNKKFNYQAYYSKNENEADNKLIEWRQWNTQFYKGCKNKKQ
jgi:cholesterol 7-dehydrogenase